MAVPYANEQEWWCPSLDDAGDGTATLNDLVGSDDGTLTNGPSWVANTDAGGVRAISFDGVNDYVSTSSQISWSTHTSPFTASAWFRVAAWETNGTFSLFSAGGAANYHVINLTVWQSKLSILASSTGTGWSFGVSPIGATTLSTGVWYHAVFTRNSSGRYDVYLNGSSDGSVTHSSNLVIDNQTCKIGGHYALATDYMANGLVDDVRLFPSLRAADDIAWLYNGGVGRGRQPFSSVPHRRRRSVQMGGGVL